MASSVSSKKRIRQQIKRRARNRWRLRTLRDAIKEFRDKELHGGATEALTAFRKACALIDRSAGKGVIHKNTAARTKSRLSKRMKTKQTQKAA